MTRECSRAAGPARTKSAVLGNRCGRSLVVFLLLLLPTQLRGQWRDWTGAKFPESEYRVLTPDETAGPEAEPTDRILDLTLVQLRGSPWSERRILSHVQRTATIYEPCGIALGEVVLARVRAAEHDLDLADVVPGAELPRTVVDLSAQLPLSTPWPAVFFLGKLTGGGRSCARLPAR